MTAPVAPVMSMSGNVYYNSGTHGSPTWVAVNNVGDIKVTDECEEAEIKIRGQGGFSVVATALRKLAYEWSMVYDPADAAQAAIKAAYVAKTPLEFLILDGPNATTGSSGIRATCQISKFPRQEPISAEMTCEVAIKPAYSANPPAAYSAI